MTKDFKIGLAVGLVAAISAVIWLCTLPKLSTKTRALQSAASRQAAPAPDNPAPVVDVPPTVAVTPAASQKTEQQPPVKFHIVRKGDTLSVIAEKYYGSPNEWPKIAAANKATLPNPDKLTPGLRLIIPDN